MGLLAKVSTMVVVHVGPVYLWNTTGLAACSYNLHVGGTLTKIRLPLLNLKWGSIVNSFLEFQWCLQAISSIYFRCECRAGRKGSN